MCFLRMMFLQKKAIHHRVFYGHSQLCKSAISSRQTLLTLLPPYHSLPTCKSLACFLGQNLWEGTWANESMQNVRDLGFGSDGRYYFYELYVTRMHTRPSGMWDRYQARVDSIFHCEVHTQIE